MTQRVAIRGVETLSSDHYVLRRYALDQRRRDGSWQRLSRQVCTRGDSAAVLLVADPPLTVLLTRQLRVPVLVRGECDGMLTELPGGLLDGDAPADAARREAEQETGYRVRELKEVLVAYMSPALLAERTHLFVGSYERGDRVSAGGGVPAEGEDVEVVELPLQEAWARVGSREIVDARTILLLQHYMANPRTRGEAR